MAIFKRHSSSSSDNAQAELGKNEYQTGVSHEPVLASDGAVEYHDHQHLHRGLKSRHITMIAIGGAIGTGLIVGTGKALAQAGPGSLFISYTMIGFIVFLVMAALGEMATWLPMSAGFTGYASRFCDPSLGFALGWW
jgi:yeast amino acid transporter